MRDAALTMPGEQGANKVSADGMASASAVVTTGAEASTVASESDPNSMPGGRGMSGEGGGGGGGDGDRAGEVPPPTRRNCGAMAVHRRLLSRDASYAAARAAIESDALVAARGERSVSRTGVTRIPVVVNVVWNTAAQNISDAQITSQIDVLNRDFRRTNADVAGTPAPFLPLTADARIEFALATVDPNGAPTSGIRRRQTTATSFNDTDEAMKSNASGGLDAWPTERYLNMWVCPRLTSPIGDLLGYAQFPGGPAATDGVVILHSAFGTVGTAAAPFNLGRTATHEIGHWLNLNHIWGDDGTGCAAPTTSPTRRTRAAPTPVCRPSPGSPAATARTATCS